jgi:cytochrome o ubiquinol oxidase subunit 1
LAIVGLLGVVTTLIARSYASDVDYYVQPDEIARIENAHLDNVAKG